MKLPFLAPGSLGRAYIVDAELHAKLWVPPRQDTRKFYNSRASDDRIVGSGPGLPQLRSMVSMTRSAKLSQLNLARNRAWAALAIAR
jgi:hypothetical protein